MSIGVLHESTPSSVRIFLLSTVPPHGLLRYGESLVAAMMFVTLYFCHLKILKEIQRLLSDLENRSSRS